MNSLKFGSSHQGFTISWSTIIMVNAIVAFIIAGNMLRSGFSLEFDSFYDFLMSIETSIFMIFMSSIIVCGVTLQGYSNRLVLTLFSLGIAFELIIFYSIEILKHTVLTVTPAFYAVSDHIISIIPLLFVIYFRPIASFLLNVSSKIPFTRSWAKRRMQSLGDTKFLRALKHVALLIFIVDLMWMVVALTMRSWAGLEDTESISAIGSPTFWASFLDVYISSRLLTTFIAAIVLFYWSIAEQRNPDDGRYHLSKESVEYLLARSRAKCIEMDGQEVPKGS